ncbi:hypothetical protein CONPUDRAFT_84215 [Coniophora puteana RWD-64-598 SS2]|uniref:Phytanoyl-CoA dioxygenase n=1 Tax=Coniophora puteana (strain RWD-64-598) TaxID=741705 RepID=A0A5M3MFX1_CONPW|nr:uncharacterized protein CONPUDRAFT_84215 [Coniophora puteana RWD-64-598 SS2]EIW77937.1 hypothetical protein CONPUDRAFT_84215 [Coniophora puteana RWD-64-598 SS2]
MASYQDAATPVHYTDPSLKPKYETNGFVIVRGLIEDADLAELLKASADAIAQTRKGDWHRCRTVGSQFPPYKPGTDFWGVQHVMHPDLGQTAFAKWYTSDRLVEVARTLLGCTEDRLQMELFNLLIDPQSHDFALRWHRDDVKADATREQEEAALALWTHGVQWNTALHEDSCLYVVPGSHKTPRTDGQRACSIKPEAPENPLDMPESIQVTLKEGETVFYNSNILHCGAYTAQKPRATLHACVGDTVGGSTRARNVLQHGMEWMEGDAFRGVLRDVDEQRAAQTQTQTQGKGRGEVMLNNLLQMRQGVTGDVGYSQG